MIIATHLHSNFEKFYTKIATKFDEIGFRTINNFAYYETAEALKKDLEDATNLITAINFIVDFEDGYILSKDNNNAYSIYHPFEYLKVLMFDALNQNLLSAIIREGILTFDKMTPAVSNTKFPLEVEEIYQELKKKMNQIAIFQLDGYSLLNENGVQIGEVVFNKYLFINWFKDENNVSYNNTTYDFNFQLELNRILFARNVLPTEGLSA